MRQVTLPYMSQVGTPNQGSKSRKISYRAIVHDFVHGQNIFRARFVHDSCTKKIVQKIEIVRKSCYLKCNITLKY